MSDAPDNIRNRLPTITYSDDLSTTLNRLRRVARQSEDAQLMDALVRSALAEFTRISPQLCKVVAALRKYARISVKGIAIVDVAYISSGFGFMVESVDLSPWDDGIPPEGFPHYVPGAIHMYNGYENYKQNTSLILSDTVGDSTVIGDDDLKIDKDRLYGGDGIDDVIDKIFCNYGNDCIAEYNNLNEDCILTKNYIGVGNENARDDFACNYVFRYDDDACLRETSIGGAWDIFTQIVGAGYGTTAEYLVMHR